MGLLSYFVAILFLAVYVNGRNSFVIEEVGKSILILEDGISVHGAAMMGPTPDEWAPSLDGLPPEFLCKTCMEVSRKAENFLADPTLLERVCTISSEVCHMLPSDLQVKWLETSEMYVQKAISYLQLYFNEENFCNGSGLCPENMRTNLISSTGMQTLSGPKALNEIMNKVWSRISEEKEDSEAQLLSPFKVQLQILNDKILDNASCTACHKALDEVINDLDKPETKIKLLRVLLKACEKIENHVKECKKLVFEYGPLIMANMEKFLTKNDLCSILHVCNADTPLTTKATDI